MFNKQHEGNVPQGVSRFQMPKFIAYAVDISGTAMAHYDLATTDEQAAEQEARQYLERHQVIEVWSNDHRRVARLVRK